MLSDSPAVRGGLRAGDVITAVDGTAVSESTEVQRIVSDGKVGQKLTVEVQRNGEVKSIEVRPENLRQ